MAGKIYYNKLVRDAIPEVIRANGSECEVRVLDDAEYEQALLKKVEEEASAFPAAPDAAELTKEIGDVLDVIDEIKRFKGITDDDIAVARAKALAKKGGFAKKLFLVWSSDDGYKTNEKKSA